jgi:GAF domain-containing protein
MAAGRPTNPWKLLERLAEEGATQGVLEEVLDCILHETEGERGFFFRLRARGGFQVLAARSHDREDIPRAESRVSHYAVHRTASTGKTLFVPDCSRDRRYRTEEAREGKRQALSILVLPLRVGEQVRGGIYVDHRFHALRKPSEVEDRLEAWISIAAIVLRMKDRRGIATDAAEDASGARRISRRRSRRGGRRSPPASFERPYGGCEKNRTVRVARVGQPRPAGRLRCPAQPCGRRTYRY